MTTSVDLADRAWDAAYELDVLYGDRKTSQWSARKVCELIRAGRQEDPEALTNLARVLEDRLAMERARIREGEEAEA